MGKEDILGILKKNTQVPIFIAYFIKISYLELGLQLNYSRAGFFFHRFHQYEEGAFSQKY